MKSKLTPFDAELKAMVADIIGEQPEIIQEENSFSLRINMLPIPYSQIKALRYAVLGRIGDRLLNYTHEEEIMTFQITYSNEAESLPDYYEERVNTDLSVGKDYQPKIGSVKAIQILRGNLDKLMAFTGGGSMTIPRSINGKATYSFLSPNGTFIDAEEGDYILWDKKKDNMTVCPESKFLNEYELIPEL